MSELIPPIGTQISALAALAPDEPAVTCDGHTITRAERDASTNRLARAYAERGVGVGDYVTIVLPNSLEWVQAAVACWKLGAVPQPLSPRLPDAEFEGLLELHPRALLVGREDPRRGDRQRGEAGRSGSPPFRPETPSVPAGFSPIRRPPMPRCRTRCRRAGSRWPTAAALANPSSSRPAATAAFRPRSGIRWACRRATPT